MTSRKLNKLSRSTLHDQTYDELRSAILAARFLPGEKQLDVNKGQGVL